MHKFFIWFQQRSGSTFLVSLLNSHPEIRCKGEVFGCSPIPFGSGERFERLGGGISGLTVHRRVLNQFPGRIDDPTSEQCTEELESFLGDGFAENRCRRPVRGFKFKFPSQYRVYPEVTSWLDERRSEINMVVLKRDNLLKRALSVMNLKRMKAATGKANYRDAVKSTPANVRQGITTSPASFDVCEILRIIENFRKLERSFYHWPRQFVRRLDIEYEELQMDAGRVLTELQQFLGVRETLSLKSNMLKSTPDDLRSFVLNYDELERELKKQQLDYLL
jgi:LPS sulfotransferase NodH